MTKMSLATRAIVTASIILGAGLFAAVPMWIPRPQIEYDMTGYSYDVPSVAVFDFNRYGPVYTTTMPENYTLINSNTPLIVAPHWKNTGTASTSLETTLTLTNANITWFSNFGCDNRTSPDWVTEADGQTCNQARLTFLSQPQSQSPILYRYIDVLPTAGANNFTVTLTVKDTASDFTLLIAHGPTTFTYVLADSGTNQYRLKK